MEKYFFLKKKISKSFFQKVFSKIISSYAQGGLVTPTHHAFNLWSNLPVVCTPLWSISVDDWMPSISIASVVPDASRTRPSLTEVVRENIDCTCAVHGYALFADSEYICDACGTSEFAEFHANPEPSTISKKQRRITPEKVGRGRSRDRTIRKLDFSRFFTQRHRSKSAPT